MTLVVSIFVRTAFLAELSFALTSSSPTTWTLTLGPHDTKLGRGNKQRVPSLSPTTSTSSVEFIATLVSIGYLRVPDFPALKDSRNASGQQLNFPNSLISPSSVHTLMKPSFPTDTTNSGLPSPCPWSRIIASCTASGTLNTERGGPGREEANTSSLLLTDVWIRILPDWGDIQAITTSSGVVSMGSVIPPSVPKSLPVRIVCTRTRSLEADTIIPWASHTATHEIGYTCPVKVNLGVAITPHNFESPEESKSSQTLTLPSSAPETSVDPSTVSALTSFIWANNVAPQDLRYPELVSKKYTSKVPMP
mmetsp:Transcript_2450/g.4888  ORF Transcript_2450/g.4888 Transcript_2450/m.4888 type:complete len:307 (+) Transcript_2450:3386-4306(+)